LRFDDFLPLPPDYRRAEPLTAPPIGETIESAEAAYRSVLDDVGANRRLDCVGRWVAEQDTIDARITAEVRTNGGSDKAIYHEDDVGGFPTIEPAEACPDADRDGMPDEWEARYGFNTAVDGDNAADSDGDGYTNIEEYLNGSDPQAP
jgi:hypothetical protein